MTVAEVKTGAATTEAVAVLRWRYDELVRAGYYPAHAHKLARQLDVDLHRAADLVRKGCPSGTALRIVL